MDLVASPTVLALAFGVLLVGGVVTGLNGFGFAVTGTAVLAALFDPQSAVVVMILPILAANVSLVGELDGDGLRSCVRRFWPFVTAAAAGTVVGMVLLSRIPTGPLTLVLGLFVLAYVAVSQEWVELPGERWVRTRCFRPDTVGKVSLGLVSGAIFGATNVGVQIVAYLESLDLDRATFVGVVAMVFLGIGVVRVGLAAALGLYTDLGLVGLSAVAAVPGLVGVALGKRVRARIPKPAQQATMFALLVLIGVRLTTRGIGL